MFLKFSASSCLLSLIDQAPCGQMIPSLSLIRYGAFGFNKQCHVILGLKSGEISILPKSWASGLGGRDESPFSPQCKLLPRHGFKDAATLCYSHLKEAAKLSLTVSNIGAVPDISLFHNPLDNVKNFRDNEMELKIGRASCRERV